METPASPCRNVGFPRLALAAAAAVGLAASPRVERERSYGEDVRSKPVKRVRVMSTRRHLQPGGRVPEASLQERARKGLARAAADAASLLNYHSDLEAPPAWALDRLQRLPEVWARHVYDRLHYGYPAPDGFPRGERDVAAGAMVGAHYVSAQGRRVVVLLVDAETPRTVRFATVDAEGKRNKSRPSESSEAEFLARFEAV